LQQIISSYDRMATWDTASEEAFFVMNPITG
jgi:hypothetical protein